MDTTELRYFRRVYEERSLNKAAGLLFITPQGLSKIIRGLENELGIALFERTKNGMVPTESGIYLYKNSDALLNQFDEITAGIRRIREQENRFRVGCSCGVLNVLPLYKLGGLEESYNTQIQWEEDSNEKIIRSVLDGSCELGFVIGEIAEQDIWVKELYSRKLDVIVYEGHPFYGRDSLSVGELEDEKFITLNERFYCYHSFVQRCRDFGFTPSILVKTMESQLIYRFCRQKLGLGIDVDIHSEDVSQEKVRRIELHDSIPWKISMIVRNDRRRDEMVKKVEELCRGINK